jgi:hypothetical protein
VLDVSNWIIVALALAVVKLPSIVISPPSRNPLMNSRYESELECVVTSIVSAVRFGAEIVVTSLIVVVFSLKIAPFAKVPAIA